MKLPESPAAPSGRWISLWVVALLSLVAQMALCQFFTFGEKIPQTIDINPSNLWKLTYQFPPVATYQTLNWLGVPYLPQPLNPLSLAAHLPPWIFFTTYAPLMATLGLLAMAAVLRELELDRPAALFGGVIYAWQGDILPFVYPAHYGYISSWPIIALAAWSALRIERTGRWPYAVISGACCGLLLGLLTNADRGGMACLLIAALFLAPVVSRLRAGRPAMEALAPLRHLALCVGVAALIALAPILALYKSNIADVKLAGQSDREETYKLVTQFSLAPAETLTYLVPGFFGWHMNSASAPYWGWIGEWPDWPKNHQGTRNLNLAISTTGTIATVLALVGVLLLLPRDWLGPAGLSDRQRRFALLFAGIGFVTLILSWGWHTPFYRPLFALPLMDKWRNPLKWVELLNFSLVVLSAFGLQHLLRTLDPDAPDARLIRRRIVWLAGTALAALVAGLALSYPLAVVLAVQFQHDGFDQSLIPNMMNTMHTSLIWAIILMALFIVTLVALWRPEPLRRFTLPNPALHRLWQTMLAPANLPATLGVALAALAVAQLGWVASQFVMPYPVAASTGSNPLLDALHADTTTNHVRCTVATDDPILNMLLQNQFAAMDISCLDISAASRVPDRLGKFLAALGDNHARLWFLAGVKDVVMPEQFMPQLQQDPSMAGQVERAEGYTLAPMPSPDLPSHALVTMKDYLAKATFVPGFDFLSESGVLQKLKDPAWNPRETILLERPVTVSVPPALGPAAATDSVSLSTYTPTEIAVSVETNRSGFILINDEYDPDWQVQVNGHVEPLLRADYLLRAVAVPAGKSDVTLTYAAHYRVAGANLSAEAISLFSDGVMLAAWLIAGVGLLIRPQRRPN